MNANFETNSTVYPIGYLLNGGSTINGPTYDIVDMRTLEAIYGTALTGQELTPIVGEINNRLRDGKYSAGASIKEDAAALIAALFPAAPTQTEQDAALLEALLAPVPAEPELVAPVLAPLPMPIL